MSQLHAHHTADPHGSRLFDQDIESVLLSNWDSNRQFKRNGRWGCCGECPKDHFGRAYPESCRETGRPDHNLGAYELNAVWEQWKMAYYVAGRISIDPSSMRFA